MLDFSGINKIKGLNKNKALFAGSFALKRPIDSIEFSPDKKHERRLKSSIFLKQWKDDSSAIESCSTMKKVFCKRRDSSVINTTKIRKLKNETDK